MTVEKPTEHADLASILQTIRDASERLANSGNPYRDPYTREAAESYPTPSAEELSGRAYASSKELTGMIRHPNPYRIAEAVARGASLPTVDSAPLGIDRQAVLSEGDQLAAFQPRETKVGRHLPQDQQYAGLPQGDFDMVFTLEEVEADMEFTVDEVADRPEPAISMDTFLGNKSRYLKSVSRMPRQSKAETCQDKDPLDFSAEGLFTCLGIGENLPKS